MRCIIGLKFSALDRLMAATGLVLAAPYLLEKLLIHSILPPRESYIQLVVYAWGAGQFLMILPFVAIPVLAALGNEEPAAKRKTLLAGFLRYLPVFVVFFLQVLIPDPKHQGPSFALYALAGAVVVAYASYLIFRRRSG